MPLGKPARPNKAYRVEGLHRLGGQLKPRVIHAQSPEHAARILREQGHLATKITETPLAAGRPQLPVAGRAAPGLQVQSPQGMGYHFPVGEEDARAAEKWLEKQGHTVVGGVNLPGRTPQQPATTPSQPRVAPVAKIGQPVTPFTLIRTRNKAGYPVTSVTHGPPDAAFERLGKRGLEYVSHHPLTVAQAAEEWRKMSDHLKRNKGVPQGGVKRFRVSVRTKTGPRTHLVTAPTAFSALGRLVDAGHTVTHVEPVRPRRMARGGRRLRYARVREEWEPIMAHALHERMNWPGKGDYPLALRVAGDFFDDAGDFRGRILRDHGRFNAGGEQPHPYEAIFGDRGGSYLDSGTIRIDPDAYDAATEGTLHVRAEKDWTPDRTPRAVNFEWMHRPTGQYAETFGTWMTPEDARSYADEITHSHPHVGRAVHDFLDRVNAPPRPERLSRKSFATRKYAMLPREAWEPLYHGHDPSPTGLRIFADRFQDDDDPRHMVLRAAARELEQTKTGGPFRHGVAHYVTQATSDLPDGTRIGVSYWREFSGGPIRPRIEWSHGRSPGWGGDVSEPELREFFANLARHDPEMAAMHEAHANRVITPTRPAHDFGPSQLSRRKYAANGAKRVSIDDVLPDKDNMEVAVHSLHQGRPSEDKRPAEVYQDGDKYILADGHHRLLQAILAGDEDFPIRVRPSDKPPGRGNVIELDSGEEFYGLGDKLKNGWLLKRLRGMYARRKYAARKPDAGHAFVSALRRLRSKQQQALHGVAKEIAGSLNLNPSVTRDALHDGTGGANPSIAQAVQGGDPATARYAAAWYGLLTRTPALGVFHVAPNGPDSAYKFTMRGSGEDVRKKLDRGGISPRVLLPRRGGWDVFVYDAGRRLRENVRAFAKVHGLRPEESVGKGETLGHADPAEARAKFRSVIMGYENKPRQMARTGRPAKYSADEDDFHAAISQAPYAGHDAIYADWLEENGRPHTAEVIRHLAGQFHPSAESLGIDRPSADIDPEGGWVNLRTPTPGGHLYWKGFVPRERAATLAAGLESEGFAVGDPRRNLSRRGRPARYASNFHPIATTGQSGRHFASPTHFLKIPDNPVHAKTEPAAASAMRSLGVETPAVQATEHEGRPAVAAPLVPQPGPMRAGSMHPHQVARTALAEWLIHASDRNPRNYLSSAGRVVPIDYAEAWHPSVFRDPEGVVGPHTSAARQEFGGGHVELPHELIRDVLSRRPAVEQAMHEGTAGLGERERDEARQLLSDKFAHLEALLKHPRPTLSHLPDYRGVRRMARRSCRKTFATGRKKMAREVNPYVVLYAKGGRKSKAWISAKIKKLIEEGKPQKQAVAESLHMAGVPKRGF